jgi:hypothetical protein
VCFKPCKICNDSSHNVTRCPKNPRMNSNRTFNSRGHESRGGYNRSQPRANIAQASTSGYLYNAFHEEGPDDFAPSAHVAHGMNDEIPPGFGPRRMEGPPTVQAMYGDLCFPTRPTSPY